MPIQHVKKQIHMMAARARTVAERQRYSSTTMVGLREIDREASKINHKLSEEEKAMVRTAQMGGTMAKQAISSFNQDVSPECNYCKEGPSTDSHVKWGCSHFEAIRRRGRPRTCRNTTEVPYRMHKMLRGAGTSN